jgi:hypothetical protein
MHLVVALVKLHAFNHTNFGAMKCMESGEARLCFNFLIHSFIH